MIFSVLVLPVAATASPAAAAASPAAATALLACPVTSSTDVVIYSGNGAASECQQWEHDFYSWLGLEAVSLGPSQLHDASCGGRLHELGVHIFAMPGGNAYDLQTSAGPMGKQHINSFIDAGGLYVGTCAGFYFAAQSYVWQAGEAGGGDFAWPHLLGRYPKVEGSITSIQDDAVPPGYRLTSYALASNGSVGHGIYWGGPTFGWRSTARVGHPGEVLLRYSAVPGELCAGLGRSSPRASRPAPRLRLTPSRPTVRRRPAAVRVSPRQRGGLLLFSLHLEAEEGVR